MVLFLIWLVPGSGGDINAGTKTTRETNQVKMQHSNVIRIQIRALAARRTMSWSSIRSNKPGPCAAPSVECWPVGFGVQVRLICQPGQNTSHRMNTLKFFERRDRPRSGFLLAHPLPGGGPEEEGGFLATTS